MGKLRKLWASCENVEGVRGMLLRLQVADGSVAVAALQLGKDETGASVSTDSGIAVAQALIFDARKWRSLLLQQWSICLKARQCLRIHFLAPPEPVARPSRPWRNAR
jgi:hypothetical protein